MKIQVANLEKCAKAATATATAAAAAAADMISQGSTRNETPKNQQKFEDQLQRNARFNELALTEERKNSRHFTDRLLDIVEKQQQGTVQQEKNSVSKHLVPTAVLCDNCEKKPPTLKCKECGLLYCEGCSADFHSLGTLKTHTISSAQCEKCNEQLANLFCGDCHISYCRNCSQNAHSKGNLRYHTTTEL
jgi:hypothetical protein